MSATIEQPSLFEVLQRPARFPLGRTVQTPGASEIGPLAVSRALVRHQRGDWGVVSAADREANERALEHGDRLLSAYLDPVTKARFWVITEADRSQTTVLLPSEY